MIKLCKICGKELPKKYQNRTTSKYCSRDCYKIGYSLIMKGHKSWNIGLTSKDHPGIKSGAEKRKGIPNKYKGKTYEDMYGEERAKQIKEKRNKNWVNLYGKNHPSWKGDDVILDKTTYHQRARRYKKNHCERCNKQVPEIKRLEVHHKDGDIKNNDPKNLITLCNRCHQVKDNRINMERDWHGRFISPIII